MLTKPLCTFEGSVANRLISGLVSLSEPLDLCMLTKPLYAGAAMALGLSHMIMSNKLPVRLRLLISAAENNIAGIHVC